MKFISPTILLLLLLCESLFGQAATPATPPQTFHVKGTISDSTSAAIPGVKVTFQDKQVKTTVDTNAKGIYEVDLPLGDYNMTARTSGFRPYRRPLFRVAKPSSLTFDITLPVAPTCDLVVVGRATAQDWAAAQKEFCLREDFFPVPSPDGVAYQLYIRYVKHTATGDRHTYTSEKFPSDDPVFAAYNLFSLQADRVTYDAKSRTIEASGEVIMQTSDEPQRADYVIFKLEDGRATQK